MKNAPMPEARDKKEAVLLKEIAHRGLRIEQYGAAWRIHGPGVDLLVTEIRLVRLSDLRPA